MKGSLKGGFTMLMLVPKGEGTIIIGEQADQPSEKEVTLKDIVAINLIPGPNGMVPVPSNYPHPLAKHLIKRKFLNELVLTFSTENYLVVDEENMEADMLTLYHKEMADRGGIILSTQMPPMTAKLVNG